MAIWSNLVRGMSSNSGFAVQPFTGITIKPFDVRPFLDEPSYQRTGSGGTRASSKSSELDDDKNPYRGKVRTGVYSGYLQTKNNIDAMISNVNKKYAQVMYDAGNTGNTIDVENAKKEYMQIMNNLSMQSMQLSVAMNNELLQKSMMDDEIAQSKGKYNDAYAIRGDVSTINSPESFFYDTPFIVGAVDGGKDVSLISFNDYINIQDTRSYLDPTDMMPIQFQKPGSMSSEKEMMEEVRTELKDAGYMDIVAGMQQNEVQERLLHFVDKIQDNKPQLMQTIDSMYDKLSNESKLRLINNTLRSGVMLFSQKKKNDKNVTAVSGNDVMKLMEAEKIKMRKIDEQLAKETDPIKIADLNEKKEKIKKAGIAFANDIIETAKYNIHNIAFNKALGMDKLTLTGEGGLDTYIEMPNGERVKIGESNPIINALAGAHVFPQNMYLEDENGVGIKRISKAKAFNLSPDLINEISNRSFGEGSAYRLQEEKINLNHIPEFVIANGVYISTSAFKDKDNIKVMNIGSKAYVLPRYYNPSDGKQYSVDIQRSENGGLIMQTYVEYRVKGDKNTEVPVVNEKGEVIMKKLKDLNRVEKGQPAYDVNEDNWTFKILTPMPEQYYGSKNITVLGAIMGMHTAQSAEIGRSRYEERRQAKLESQFKDFVPSGQGSFAYGKSYEGTPEEVYKQIRAEVFKPGVTTEESERSYLSLKNSILDNIPDKTMREEYKREFDRIERMNKDAKKAERANVVSFN